MRDGADQVASGVEVGQDPPARLGQVQPGVAFAVLVDPAGVVEDVDHRQLVAAAGRIVVGVMGWGDLDGASPKLGPDDRITDDRHDPLDERHEDLRPHQVTLTRIVGMDGDSDITQEGLRAGRGDLDPAIGPDRTIGINHVIADRPEGPGLGRRHDLEIAQRGLAADAPVREGLGPIRQVPPVEPGERGSNCPRAGLVHREPEPAPVEGRTEPVALADDRLARGVHECPHPLEIALPSKGGP